MKLERLMALMMSIAVALASSPVVRVAAQAVQPVAASQQAVQATGLAISGTVVGKNRKPIGNACLRLRKMDTNAVVGRTVSNQNGAFTFPVSAPGMYLVEVIRCDNADVLAVSDALTLAQAPLTATVVMFPTAATAAGFFSSTAFLMIAGASAAGITVFAVNSNSQNVVSPEQ